MKKIFYHVAFYITFIILGCLGCHVLGVFPFFSPDLPPITPSEQLLEITRTRKLVKVDTVNAPKGEIYIAHYQEGQINTYFKKSDILDSINYKTSVKVIIKRDNTVAYGYFLVLGILFALSVFFRNKMDLEQKGNL